MKELDKAMAKENVLGENPGRLFEEHLGTKDAGTGREQRTLIKKQTLISAQTGSRTGLMNKIPRSCVDEENKR